jgi:cation diffusion facilitator family transporter
MAVGKGIGGVVFHSQALIADSIHAVSDLVSDFLTLATVTLGGKPATKYFPNGYGRVESLGSLSVSVLLIMAGISMGWGSFLAGAHHLWGEMPWLEMISLGHSHSHGSDDLADINAAWLALGSIFIKEWLYQATMKVAKQTGSTVLEANAWHHRIDSLVSIVAVLTISTGYLWDIKWLDPVGGFIVSLMIAKAGYSTAKAAAIELSGGIQRLEPEVPLHYEKITSALSAVQSHGERFSLVKLEVIPSGPNYVYHMCLQSVSSSNNKLSEFILVSEALRHELLSTDNNLKRVIIEPTEEQRPSNEDD